VCVPVGGETIYCAFYAMHKGPRRSEGPVAERRVYFCFQNVMKWT